MPFLIPDDRLSPPFGKLRYLATDYGISTKNPDNTAALQALCDRVAADMAKYRLAAPYPDLKGVIHFPDGVFYLGGPVYHQHDAVVIEGERTTMLMMIPGCGYDAFVVGLNRDGISPAVRPDLFGVLDSSVVSATGQKFGVRMCGTNFVGTQGSVLSAGQYGRWYNVDACTFEFKIRASGAIPGNSYIFGIERKDQDSHPRPIRLTTTNDNSFRLEIATQPFRFSNNITESDFWFNVQGSGPKDIAICIDMNKREVFVFVDEVQVKVDGRLPAEGILLENQDSPLGIGGIYWPYPTDYEIDGFCVSKSVRYANLGAGQPKTAHPQMVNWGNGLILSFPGVPASGSCQIGFGSSQATLAMPPTSDSVRNALASLPEIGSGNITVSAPVLSAGGATLSFQVLPVGNFTIPGVTQGMCNGSGLAQFQYKDIYRYFPSFQNYAGKIDPYSMAFLSMEGNPGERHLPIEGGELFWGIKTSAFVFGEPFIPAAVNGIEFRDITVTNWRYGNGLHLFYLLGLKLERANFCGGSNGYANYPTIANYQHFINNCGFQGTDHGIYAHTAALTVEKTTVMAEWGVKTVGGDITLDHIDGSNISEQAAHLAFFSGAYGGKLAVKDSISDREGGNTLLAHVYCEAHNFCDTSIYLQDFYIGTLGKAPIVMLRNPNGNVDCPTPVIFADGLRADTLGPVVDCDTDNWTGKFVRCLTRNVSKLDSGPLQASRGQAKPRVQVIDEFDENFPRYGTTLRENVICQVSAAPDGCYREWHPVVSGTDGTKNPTKWLGVNPYVSDPNCTLAGYALDHHAITMSGASCGYVTTAGINSMTAKLTHHDYYLATEYAVALFHSPANKQAIWLDEVAVSGYARQVLPNNTNTFPLTTSGSKAIGASLTFGPYSSGVWIQSFGFADANPGRSSTFYAMIQLEKPLYIPSGEAWTIPANSIRFEHVPYRSSQIGSMSDEWWGKLLDYQFGGVNFSSPTLYVTLDAPGCAVVPITNPNIYRVNFFLGQNGDIRNSAPIVFDPPPSGHASRFTVVDAPVSGMPVWSGPLTNPIFFGSEPAMFDTGSLLLSVA